MKKDLNKRHHFDLGIILLITGAISNITIWIGAFVSTETQGPIGEWVRAYFLPVLGGVSGLAMGITIAAGLVYVIARLNRMKPTTERKERGRKRYKHAPNVRFYGAWAAIVLLMVISPALLAPYVYMTISGTEKLFLVLGSWTWAWSVGRILAADLALGAVAMVQGVHLGASATDARPSHTASTTTSAPQSVRTAKTDAKTAKEMRPCDVPGCGIPYVWPQGKGAHYKQHHQNLVIQKGIPVQMVNGADARKEEKQS